MKFQVLLLPLAALAITVTASPVDPEGALAGPNIAARGAQIMHEFEKRKGCSKRRLTSDVCEGKKLQPQHSFHNCGNAGGKCCALNKDGSGGIALSDGAGREDCGYCFSGKCKG
ncbi:hypothetical protein MMC14_008993 [Varicellaria rhodocarpa]|nr:hypothetical protein [Varicellaria rhodocarpa]